MLKEAFGVSCVPTSVFNLPLSVQVHNTFQFKILTDPSNEKPTRTQSERKNEWTEPVYKHVFSNVIYIYDLISITCFIYFFVASLNLILKDLELCCESGVSLVMGKSASRLGRWPVWEITYDLMCVDIQGLLIRLCISCFILYLCLPLLCFPLSWHLLKFTLLMPFSLFWSFE